MDYVWDHTSGLEPNDPRSLKQLTFHSFPRLPAELREKIWQSATPKPCCIFSAKHECSRYESAEDGANFRAIIQTCHEAREQFIYRTTEPPMQAKKSHPMYRACHFPPSFSNVFFSFELDSLHFMFARYLDMLKPNSELLLEGSKGFEDYKYVKNISAGLDEFIKPTGTSSSSNDDEPYTGFHSLPKFFWSLETITLLTSDTPLTNSGGTTVSVFADMWILVENNKTQKQVIQAQEQFELVKTANPEWNPPLLKFRGYEEYMANPLEL